MQNPFGTSPIIAWLQGKFLTVGAGTTMLETLAACGCSATSSTAANPVLSVLLNTGVDDNVILPTVSQFGQAPVEVDTNLGATEGSPNQNLVTFTFTAPTSGALFNIVFYVCYDGIDNTP